MLLEYYPIENFVMKIHLHSLLLFLCIAFASASHAKNIVVYIDGTGDSPETNIENGDKSPTNIQRMADLTVSDGEVQVSIYIQGLATGEGLVDVERSNEKEFYFGRGAKAKRKEAYDRIISIHDPGDKLYLFGFSRGAAIARDLANFIVDKGLDENEAIQIEMIGMFDCVASFGIPINIFAIPTQQINLWKKLTIPESVSNVYHLVAIHETRSGFEPTLVNRRYEELWFAGTHKDIGGGYIERGMANLTMRYMMVKAENHGVIFKSNGYCDINSITLGPDMFMFRDENAGQSEHETRKFGVGRYGDEFNVPVKLHASVPYWERMQGRTISLSNVPHIFVE